MRAGGRGVRVDGLGRGDWQGLGVLPCCLACMTRTNKFNKKAMEKAN
jgi:hypothetical protein